MFNKDETIRALQQCIEDRKIQIFKYERIDENIYLIHYITKFYDDIIYRTSIEISNHEFIVGEILRV